MEKQVKLIDEFNKETYVSEKELNSLQEEEDVKLEKLNEETYKKKIRLNG
jgi:hypothetical protein